MSANDASRAGQHEDVVVRKAGHGWVVGDENVSDLTSAMVLADLLAADQADGDQADGDQADGDQADGDDTTVLETAGENGTRQRRVTPPKPRANDSGPLRIPAVSTEADTTGKPGAAEEAQRLAVTVARLEHALTARVLVEQAIGILAERHRLRPREAFDLLRKVSRSRGARVAEMAQDVVASTSNPLLRLPEELARTMPGSRSRTRSLRRSGRHAANS